MKNFSIKNSDGEIYWISRSVAVSSFILCKFPEGWKVLANKRGKGAADFQGYWNCPCGYLDFDETTKEAAIREVFEETGVKVPKHRLTFWKFIDSPSQNRQNVTFRYYAILDNQPSYISVSMGDRGGEVDEVEMVGWISVEDLDKYEWAFGHKEIIRDLIEHLELS